MLDVPAPVVRRWQPKRIFLGSFLMQRPGMRSLVVSVALIAAAGFAGFGLRPVAKAAAGSAVANATDGEIQHAPLGYRGVASCAAAACHNAADPSTSKRSEYTVWLDRDRHARAYIVLLEERSRIIERNYRRLASVADARPERDKLCLQCHALAASEHASSEINLEGVSCERCHGSAEKWLSTHYLAGWREKSDAEKVAQGMTPTKNLLYRARMCAACHIGTPEKDVNHDLYAAGHPPLYYEFSSYLGSMPRHWSQRDDKGRYPDFEIRAWAVGQVVSAQAALELLAKRAGNHGEPWPEFAEYNCYACHHDLYGTSPRLLAEPPRGRKIGLLTWGTWFTPLLDAAVTTDTRDVANLKDLQTLRATMQHPSSDRVQVARLAKSVVQELAAWTAAEPRLDFARDYADRLAQRLREQSAAADFADWESATQRYLARAALYHARQDFVGADPSEKRELERMRDRLSFPPGFLSPANFGKR